MNAPLPVAQILGSDAARVGEGRTVVRRHARWVFYADGVEVRYRDGVADRINVEPCRLTPEDLRRLGFAVNADVRIVHVTEWWMVEGLPGVHIEGRARRCWISRG